MKAILRPHPRPVIYRRGRWGWSVDWWPHQHLAATKAEAWRYARGWVEHVAACAGKAPPRTPVKDTDPYWWEVLQDGNGGTRS